VVSVFSASVETLWILKVFPKEVKIEVNFELRQGTP
jgi:hypothetical protein